MPLSSRWLIVPTRSVSSSLNASISHLWWLLCPPAYQLSHSPALQHVQGSAPTVVFKGGCWPWTYSSLGIPLPLFTFCNKRIDSVRMMACVVQLSPPEAIQLKAWATASTSIVHLEVETIIKAARSLWTLLDSDWSLVTEPSVYTKWDRVVCCFLEWEAWSLTWFCLLTILDSVLPGFLAQASHRDTRISSLPSKTDRGRSATCCTNPKFNSVNQLKFTPHHTCWWRSSRSWVQVRVAAQT